MTEEGQTAPNDTPQQTSPSTSVPVNEKANNVVEANEDGGDKKENNYPRGSNLNPFIVKVDKKKGWARSEIISTITIAVSLALFTLNVISFRKTSQSVDISKRSLELAERKEKNDSVIKAKAFRVDSANIAKKFILDSLSLNAQIQSLKEASKQFIVGNEPILQIEDFELTSFEAGKEPTLTFNIRNLGAYPVKVTNSATSVAYRFNPPNYDSIGALKKRDILAVNSFINKDKPYPIYHYAPRQMNQPTIDYLRKVKGQVWFFGYIDYQNLITKGKKRYKFVIYTPPMVGGDALFHLNENIGLDKRGKEIQPLKKN